MLLPQQNLQNPTSSLRTGGRGRLGGRLPAICVVRENCQVVGCAGRPRRTHQCPGLLPHQPLPCLRILGQDSAVPGTSSGVPSNPLSPLRSGFTWCALLFVPQHRVVLYPSDSSALTRKLALYPLRSCPGLFSLHTPPPPTHYSHVPEGDERSDVLKVLRNQVVEYCIVH